MTALPTLRHAWSALLSCAVLVVASASGAGAQANLVGSWDLSVETDQGAGFVVLALTQAGDSISGTYSGTFGSGVPGGGTVRGNEFTLRFPVTDDVGLIGGASGDIVFQGTIEPADTMAGTYDLSSLLVGTFQGTRQATSAPARGGGPPGGG